ncbi:MAG: hypothetical protein HQK83_00385 [Fibrobacteria bacterium]|nr:hypothetical protein [Fibrobacteria bacterium]
MRNNLIFICLLAVLGFPQSHKGKWFESNKEQVPAKEHNSINSDWNLASELSIALPDYHRYFRSGRHQKLLQKLKNDNNISPTIFTQDSLETVLEHAKKKRNDILHFIANIVMYAQTRTISEDRACKALSHAAATAFHQINNPSLSQSVYELSLASACVGAADSLKKIQTYINTDLPVANILQTKWHNTSEEQKRQYITTLQQTLEEYPSTSLKLRVFKTIGDVYYSLKKYRLMRSWYKKAVMIDSSIAKNTPVGYRILRGEKFIMRDNTVYAAYGAYFIILCIIIFRIMRYRKNFDYFLFLKKTVLFLVLYGLASGLIGYLDAQTFLDTAVQLAVEEPQVVSPAVPLSIFDNSFWPKGIWVLVLGFIPVLLIILYTSFKATSSFFALATIIFLSVTAIWGHLFIVYGYDEAMMPQHYFRTMRIYFDGELEKVLTENPQKAINANPGILNSDNIDLNMFLKNHFPNGLGKATEDQ